MSSMGFQPNQHHRTISRIPLVCFDNIQATWNVIEAAVRYHVPRIVYASSNHAVKALEKTLAPACYTCEGSKIDSDAPPRPVNLYGISKGFGEMTGRMFVDEGQLTSFIAGRLLTINIQW